MLTSPSNLPANSMVPPSDADLQERADSVYQMFRAGLVAKFASDCIPGPSAFQYLPAPSQAPMTQVGNYPALNSVTLVPGAVAYIAHGANGANGRAAGSNGGIQSPIVSNVRQSQERVRRMLVDNSAALVSAAHQAGGQGASATPGDFEDAAEVLPMGMTQQQLQQARDTGAPATLEIAGGAAGSTGNAALRNRRAGSMPSEVLRQAGAPWGASSATQCSGPFGSVTPAEGNSWAKLFIGVGLAIAALAVANGSSK